MEFFISLVAQNPRGFRRRGSQETKGKKMTVRYTTARGANRLSSSPYYIGIVQHERTMSKKEAYAHFAEKTGYTPTQVRAAFMALAEYVRENQGRGNITFIDEVTSVRNYVSGAFEGLAGPWVKGRNLLVVESVEMEPFKSLLADATLVNNTEGAKPVINTVFDETSGEYGVIAGTGVFSVAGADLAPDATKDDEYVCIVDDMGVETKAVIEFSDLQNVKAAFVSAPEPGDYTLAIYTRSGMGEEFGVKKVTRKVTVK